MLSSRMKSEPGSKTNPECLRAKIRNTIYLRDNRIDRSSDHSY